MLFVKAFVILLTIICINAQTENTKRFYLAESICDLQHDVMSSKSDNYDVLIGNLGGKIWSTIVGDIIECIGTNHPVIVTDMRNKIRGRNLRKAALVILALNRADKVSKLLLP